MKILLLRQYNPYVENSASANRFRGLIEGLCHEGHSVTIGVTGGFIKCNEITKVAVPDDHLSVVYLSHSNHYNGLMGRLNTYFVDDFCFPLVRMRLKQLLKQNFDIVWLTSNGIVLRLFLKEEKRLTCKTFIELNEFNDIYKEEKQGNFLQRRKGIKTSKTIMKALGKIDLFAVMTNTLINYYQQKAKSEAQFFHLPMTVDLSRFYNVTDTDACQKPYFGFTGTMNNHKDGVDILIKAFAKIANKYPVYHLYLAGFWHYDVPMQEKLIADFGLKDRIHYIGVLNRDQIPPFVVNANALVLSRPDSHQAQGGFPTKLGEYLASGNPVCVTKVGEIPDYLEDNVSAFMAEPGDVDSFADAMDRALRDANNAKQVGANGRKVAEEHFSAEKQAKRLVDFLEKNIQ